MLSLPASPAAARSPFEAALDSRQRSFSGFGAASASNALVDLEAITSQRSIASSKVPCTSLIVQSSLLKAQGLIASKHRDRDPLLLAPEKRYNTFHNAW